MQHVKLLRVTYLHEVLVPVRGGGGVAHKALYQKRNAIKRNDFSTGKSAAQNARFIFLISEAQRNFSNKLFNSVEAQRNSAITERSYRNKLKGNLTSAIEISQHNANTAVFAIFVLKRVNN